MSQALVDNSLAEDHGLWSRFPEHKSQVSSIRWRTVRMKQRQTPTMILRTDFNMVTAAVG